MTTTGMRGRLWLLYLATGLAVAVGSLRLPGLQASIGYQLTGLSAVVAILIGMRLRYAGLTTYGGYNGGLLDLGWMTSYLCWGPAALIAPALLLYQGARGLAVDWVSLGAGSVVLFLLVVARMSELVAQVQDQAAQLAALANNDALTGIPKRRAWDLDLGKEMQNRVVAAPPAASQPGGDREPSPVGTS